MQLDVNEAAKQLGLARKAIYALIDGGDLPAADVRKPGGRRALYRISQDSIDDFLRRRSVKPKPTAPRRGRTAKAASTRQWV